MTSYTIPYLAALKAWSPYAEFKYPFSTLQWKFPLPFNNDVLYVLTSKNIMLTLPNQYLSVHHLHTIGKYIHCRYPRRTFYVGIEAPNSGESNKSPGLRARNYLMDDKSGSIMALKLTTTPVSYVTYCKINLQVGILSYYGIKAVMLSVLWISDMLKYPLDWKTGKCNNGLIIKTDSALIRATVRTKLLWHFALRFHHLGKEFCNQTMEAEWGIHALVGHHCFV